MKLTAAYGARSLSAIRSADKRELGGAGMTMLWRFLHNRRYRISKLCFNRLSTLKVLGA